MRLPTSYAFDIETDAATYRSLLEAVSDLVLVVEDWEFPVHRKILASRSAAFKQMLYSNFKEAGGNRIEITDAHPIAFKILLELLYTNKSNDLRRYLQFKTNIKNAEHGRCTHFYQWVYYGSFFKIFWNSVQSLLDVSERFNATVILKKKLDEIMKEEMQMNPKCAICMNAFILAVEQDLEIPKKPVLFDINTYEAYDDALHCSKGKYRPVILYSDIENMMRVLFALALLGAVSALSLPIVGPVLSGLPIVGPILGGSGGSSGLLDSLPILGNLLNTVGGVLGQLLNNILINVGIILNAVLNIADEALGAVNVIVNGLLNGLLDDATVQQLLSILPSPVQGLVSNLVQAVQCIVNDLQAAVPAVQKAVIQIIGLLTSPAFAAIEDANTQLSMILNIVGNLVQEEITVVNTILQRLADALNNKGCSTGPVSMPTPPSLPGFSLPALGGGSVPSVTPSAGGLGLPLGL